MVEKSLTPIEQKTVIFYEDELTAVRADDGRVYVAVTQMCNALGLDAPTQRRRIQNHDVLNEGYQRGWLKTPPSVDGRGGGEQETSLLRVDLVPLWLAGVRLSRVKDEIRDKLRRFQREAAAVLWEAFQEGRLTADPFDDLLATADEELVQAYELAQAIVRLAKNQIILSSRLDSHDAMLADYGRRLESIEADLHHEERYISEDEATQISQAVRAIAFEISKTTGKNEYGRCWGEFYRKFGVSKYRHLPIAKFDEAMAWLGNWYQEVMAGDVPF